MRLWNPEGFRWRMGIRLHPRQLRDPKIKHECMEATSEEEQERLDFLSKRGRLAPPNDGTQYCDMERSGIHCDQVSVFRNPQGGRKRTLGLTLAELTPSPNTTAPVVSKLDPFILQDAIFEPLVSGDAIALGLPGLPRGSRLIDGLEIVIRHQSTRAEKPFRVLTSAIGLKRPPHHACV